MPEVCPVLREAAAGSYLEPLPLGQAARSVTSPQRKFSVEQSVRLLGCSLGDSGWKEMLHLLSGQLGPGLKPPQRVAYQSMDIKPPCSCSAMFVANEATVVVDDAPIGGSRHLSPATRSGSAVAANGALSCSRTPPACGWHPKEFLGLLFVRSPFHASVTWSTALCYMY